MQPLFFPVVALVALIGVRLLGIRLGWWRVLLVAWLGSPPPGSRSPRSASGTSTAAGWRW